MEPDKGWLGIDDILWITILFIFLATLLAAFIRRVRKDKCLRLFDRQHVTYLDPSGTPYWGDLWASSQGLELRFDAPYTTSRGLTKTGVLIPPEEWRTAVALCRVESALTPEERRERERQVRRTFRPGPHRRLLRALQNFVNVIRDAVVKSVSVFVGSLGAKSGAAAAILKQKGEVDALSQTLLGVVANAYEPLLERHIGEPVVLEILNPPGAKEPRLELPGYLVDYTEHLIAVFHVGGDPEEHLDVEVEDTLEREGLRFEVDDARVRIACPGPDALVVKQVRSGEETFDLGVALLPGCTLEVTRRGKGAVRVVAERTRQLDVVCPRQRARVRFISAEPGVRREGWTGLSPAMEG